MARLPSFRRVFLSDYSEEEQPLVSKLSQTINQGLETLFDALNKKISLGDNILCTVKDVVIQVDSSGTPQNATSFQLDITGTIVGCVVLKAENLTNTAVYPTSSPFISYTQTQNGIRIDHVTGLQSNNQYRLRIVAFG